MGINDRWSHKVPGSVNDFCIGRRICDFTDFLENPVADENVGQFVGIAQFGVFDQFLSLKLLDILRIFGNFMLIFQTTFYENVMYYWHGNHSDQNPLQSRHTHIEKSS